MEGTAMLVLVGGGMILILGILSYVSQNYNLDGFRDKTVGHGQHGTARSVHPIHSGEMAAAGKEGRTTNCKRKNAAPGHCSGMHRGGQHHRFGGCR